MNDSDRRPAAADPAAVPAPARGGGVTYEAARAELEEIVRRLEAGGSSLEESLTLWERGEELAGVCQTLLDGARTRLAGGAGAAAAPVPGTARDPAGR